MSAETPAGLRAARRLLRLFSPYSESLIDDLVEVFRERSTTYGAFVNQAWFLREVGYACLYGLKDTVTDIAQGAASADVTLRRARHGAFTLRPSLRGSSYLYVHDPAYVCQPEGPRSRGPG